MVFIFILFLLFRQSEQKADDTICKLKNIT